MNQLWDLIEYWFDHQNKCFVKKQTHKTNVPKSICYAEKKRLENHCSLHTRFKIVRNGETQYTNTFKKKKTLTESVSKLSFGE